MLLSKVLQYSHLLILRCEECTVRYGNISFLIASLANPPRGRADVVLRIGSGGEWVLWVMLSVTPCRGVLHKDIHLHFTPVITDTLTTTQE